MKRSLVHLTISGLLIATGIAIPMFAPKIILPPASFTLASHVVIFLAMFISPAMAVTVAAGTTIGFFLGGFPLVVVLRAASHIVFAAAGALYLAKSQNTLVCPLRLRVFSLSVAILHAAGELIVVGAFILSGGIDPAAYRQGFLSVFLLVGLGTVVHSMVDFEIANAIRLATRKQILSLRTPLNPSCKK
ncbi:MAG: hypothetical protein FWG72_03860 [Oscillospiraceae bacterium]|nr:hypothetical protein [Oscillospiraceae bacterium]